MKKVIYYFTGTGNSMRAAKVIAARLGDTDIISMRCNPGDVSAISISKVKGTALWLPISLCKNTQICLLQ